MNHPDTTPAPLARRRRHIKTVRRRVVAVAVTAFAIAWAAIFGQLASGHDPALSKTTQAKASTKTQTKKSSAASAPSSSSSTPSSSSSTPTTSSPQPAQPLAPVTTHQS